MRTPLTPKRTIPERIAMIQNRLDISSISPECGATGAQGGPGCQRGRGTAARAGEGQVAISATRTEPAKRTGRLFCNDSGIMLLSSISVWTCDAVAPGRTPLRVPAAQLYAFEPG